MVAVVCRTCLSACARPSAQPLFPANGTPPLADVLAEVTQLQILNSNNLPDIICTACHIQLCHSQQFIKRARESHHLLCTNLSKVSTFKNVDFLNDSIKKGREDAPKIDFIDDNCKDICDEFGITIDNEQRVCESINTFQGDISIIYNDKATQVNFECEHAKVPNANESAHVNGVLDRSSSPLNNQDSKMEYENYDSFERFNDCEIKQEPEDYATTEYDETESYSNNVPEDNILTIGQIKIEPLSEDDALKFHQGTFQYNAKSNTLDTLNADNAHSNECSSPEAEYLDEDIKPTEEELIAYSKRISVNVKSKETEDEKSDDSSCNKCNDTLLNGSVLRNQKQLLKTIVEKCILCNKCFKNRKRLKQHVILQHSYYEHLQCVECHMNFMNSVDLNLHKMTHNSLPPPPSNPPPPPPPSLELCTICNLEFDTTDKFKTHLSSHKEIVLLKNGDVESTICIKCNNSFDTTSDFFTHLKKSSCSIKEESEDKANIWVNILNQKIKLEERSHKEKVVIKKKLKKSCPHCKDKFSNIHLLKKHLKTHQKVKKALPRSFVCSLCMYKFKRKDHLHRHLDKVHKIPSEDKRNSLVLLL